jgi:hypothetical protein
LHVAGDGSSDRGYSDQFGSVACAYCEDAAYGGFVVAVEVVDKFGCFSEEAWDDGDGHDVLAFGEGVLR